MIVNEKQFNITVSESEARAICDALNAAARECRDIIENGGKTKGCYIQSISTCIGDETFFKRLRDGFGALCGVRFFGKDA